MPMYSACGNAALPALGFPIRASADHGLFRASPRLIAAVHALHRLLVPRHPPCALPILTVINSIGSQGTDRVGDTRSHRARGAQCFVGMIVQFSRSARGARPDWAFGLSKLSSDSRRLEATGTGPVDILRKTRPLPAKEEGQSDVSLERR